jgi:hypothetical protein
VSIGLDDSRASGAAFIDLVRRQTFDGVVNNVGLARLHLIGEIDLRDVDNMLRVNVHARSALRVPIHAVGLLAGLAAIVPVTGVTGGQTRYEWNSNRVRNPGTTGGNPGPQPTTAWPSATGTARYEEARDEGGPRQATGELHRHGVDLTLSVERLTAFFRTGLVTPLSRQFLKTDQSMPIVPETKQIRNRRNSRLNSRP